MRIPTGITTRNKTILPTLAGVSVKAALTTPILYYSLNGGTVTQKVSPTITHQGTNMAGQHKLLVDFGTTITAGNEEEELSIKITSADCDDIHLTIEIFDPHQKFLDAVETMVIGTATGTPTTIEMRDSTLSETTDDHYKDRSILWVDGVLAGQQRTITGYTGSTRAFAFAATTDAAGAGDKYIVI